MKSREHVITNGRAVFYACCWPDLKDAALNCGWALGLHGSLNSDMDLMAMPWTEDAKPVEEMIKALEACFTIPDPAYYKQTTKSTDKPNNRAVYTMHIFADFYLDINVIEQSTKVKAHELRMPTTDEIKDIIIREFGDKSEGSVEIIREWLGSLRLPPEPILKKEITVATDNQKINKLKRKFDFWCQCIVHHKPIEHFMFLVCPVCDCRTKPRN